MDGPKSVQLVGLGRWREGRVGYGDWTFGGRGGDGDLREYDMHWRRRKNGDRHHEKKGMHEEEEKEAKRNVMATTSSSRRHVSTVLLF